LTSEVPFCQGDGGGRGRPLWPLCVPAGRRVGDSLEGRRGRRRSQGLASHHLEKTYAGRAAPSGTGISDATGAGAAARITSRSCRRTVSRE